jgi:hypothetical protein
MERRALAQVVASLPILLEADERHGMSEARLGDTRIEGE